MLLLLEEEADRTTTKFRKAKSRDRREAENNEKWGCNPPPIFGKNGISGHVACCMLHGREQGSITFLAFSLTHPSISDHHS